MNRTIRLGCVVLAEVVLCLGVFAQSPGKIEISKMNPAGLLVDSTAIWRSHTVFIISITWTFSACARTG